MKIRNYRYLTKRRIILAITLTMCIIYLVGFLNEYRIINNNYFLKKEISETLIEKYETNYDTDSLKIREKVKIDNKLIVFYTFNEEGAGWIKLEQGYNLSYDLESHMNGIKVQNYFNILNTVIHTKGGHYLLIMGGNSNDHSSIQFEFENIRYQEVLPKQKYFLIYVKIPDNSDPKSSPKDISFN